VSSDSFDTLAEKAVLLIQVGYRYEDLLSHRGSRRHS